MSAAFPQMLGCILAPRVTISLSGRNLGYLGSLEGTGSLNWGGPADLPCEEAEAGFCPQTLYSLSNHVSLQGSGAGKGYVIIAEGLKIPKWWSWKITAALETGSWLYH